MNFHSMFVHFPIALLMIYSLFEFVSFKFITKYENWFYIKATFLIIGFATAFPALLTGGILEDLSERQGTYEHRLIELHSTFAGATTIFYGLIAFVYIIALIAQVAKVRNYVALLNFMPAWWGNLFQDACQNCVAIIKRQYLWITALIGIILISITGGLGGILSSGLGVDPFADAIYHLFF
ncbi:hypothetical protein IT409_02190 [Candidatus Falkowbacteria bacterium]|nr:hypothetical protein [Candidatus Falkowbacteria bacterium]